MKTHLHLVKTNPPASPALRERLIRLPEVENAVGFRKTTIYAMMQKGEFPKAIRLNSRTVAWPESSVLTWIQNRIAASQGGKQ